MRTKNRQSRALVWSLIMLLAVALASSSSRVYAKGAQRSPSGQNSGDSGYRAPSRDSQSDSRSNERSAPSRETRQVPRPDPPRQDPPRQNPPRTEYRPEVRSESNSNDNSSPPPQVNRTEEDRPVVQAPQRAKGRDDEAPTDYNRREQPNSGNQNRSETRQESTPQYRTDARSRNAPPTVTDQPTRRGEVQVPQRAKGRSETTVTPDYRTPSSRSGVQTGQRSESNTSRPSVVQGVYRKEYADLGQMWKDRRERRDTRSDRLDRSYDGRDHNGSGVHVNINVFPGSYHYYAYDYDPYQCYPSVYCYYYGLFPPYIRSQRIVYNHRPQVMYNYIDVPMSRYRYLSESLNDIKRGWERGDPDLLMEHVRRGDKIDIFLKDDYAYTLDWQDFSEMTDDAMSHIQTESFDFYKVRQRSSDVAVAYGAHTYYDYDSYDSNRGEFLKDNKSSSRGRNTVYVRYTLERHGDTWYITEAGSSPNKF